MKKNNFARGITWVGAIDWNLRNFHGYLTQKGSTYNSYLIEDETTVLIDTVKPHLWEDHLDNLRQVTDLSSINHIVLNHIEMDHSGSLPKLMEQCPEAEIITSIKGQQILQAHYGDQWKVRTVENGESISIGKRNLTFYHTPMVHWPDNMVTYCPEEKILFSNDAFGQHLATSERFDHEYSLDIIILEAKKYFANIVLPYATQVNRALEAVSKLDISVIAPSHGLAWKKHIDIILDLYKGWSQNQIGKKALVIYDTMWGSTETIAHEIEKVFSNNGYATRLLNLQTNHISDIMTEVIDAEYICVGSPTLNNDMLPTVAAFLTYFRGLAPKNRKGLAFGSYGWGGQSVKNIESFLQSAKLECLPALSTQFIPDQHFLDETGKKLENLIANTIY